MRAEPSRSRPEVASFCVDVAAASSPYAVSLTASVSPWTTCEAFSALPERIDMTFVAFPIASSLAVAFPTEPAISWYPLEATENSVFPTKVPFIMSAIEEDFLAAFFRLFSYPSVSSLSWIVIWPSVCVNVDMLPPF